MPESILTVHNLTKSYRGRKVVDHVSMIIDRGDIYGFVGINGAGKTTFMKILCGLVKPAEGNICLFGETGEKNLEKARRKIGALIEHPALYTSMNAMANLEIQGRYLNIDSGGNLKVKLKELLKLVGLEDVGNKKVGAYSMGMKQRLGLAVALIGEPDFLILDEPYVGLDPVGVMELRNLLKRLNQEKNLTIFFSSHNLDQMTQLATRYGFLHNGKLMKELSAQSLTQECEQGKLTLEDYFTSMVAEWKEGMLR